MIIQRKIQEIIKKMALEYGIPENEVRKIVFSSYEMLCNTMKSAEKNKKESFKNVRIINLGLFAVKKGRLKRSHIGQILEYRARILSEINDVIERNKSLFKEYNIEFENKTSEDIMIKADKLRLGELIENLMIQGSMGDGRVWFALYRLAQRPNQVGWAIRDVLIEKGKEMREMFQYSKSEGDQAPRDEGPGIDS